LRLTISFINRATLRTGTRSVARVNQCYQHARQLRLVLDKLSQLIERPGVVLPPLAVPNSDSVTDTAQIFQSDTPASVFSLCNNALTDNMVDMGRKTGFFTGTLLEKARGSLRPLRLKFAPEFSVAFSETIDLIPGVGLPVRVGGDIHNAQVNAKELRRVIGGRFLDLAHLVKVEIAVAINKVGFPTAVLKKLSLLTSGYKWNLQSAVKRPDRNKLVSYLPGEDAFVISDAPMPIESARGLPVNLVGISNLSQYPNHYLSRESKPTPEVIVEEMVQVVLAKSLGLPSMAADIVGSIIHSLQCLHQRLVLLFSRYQFNLSYQFHKSIIAYTSSLDKKGIGGFLCQINQAISAA